MPSAEDPKTTATHAAQTLVERLGLTRIDLAMVLGSGWWAAAAPRSRLAATSPTRRRPAAAGRAAARELRCAVVPARV